MPVPDAQPTGGLPAVAQPMAQPMGGLTAAQPAFNDDDDYTGRMGLGGEPERYSTMSGGDPRLVQQREIERQQQRLKDPVAIRSWMTTNKKDVRGTKPADSITLQPGKQYQIIDFTGKNDGEVIASGSTPEEFLRIQDIAENLASKGRMADWRLQEVSDEPSNSKFGSALEPTTGKYITTLGGDLYNKSGWSTVADIAKIAAPIALQFVPGFGQALGLKLGLKALAAKAVGIGLTSAAGRAGAGVATGEKLGNALKAGAISGLASGATAGILGGLSAPTPGATTFPAGALSGAPMSVIPARVISSAIPTTAFSGLGSAAADVGKEIVVNAARNAATSGLSNLASGAISAGVGAGTGALSTAAAPQANQPQPGEAPGIVVSGSRIPKAGLDSILAAGTGAATSGFDQFLSDNAGMVGDEPELLAEAERIKRFEAEAAAAAAAGGALPAGALSAAEGTVEPEALAEADRIKRFEAEAAAAAAAGAAADTPSGEKKTDLPRIIGAGTGVLTLLDQLLGGGGGGGGGGGTAGTRASLSPIFSAKLPEARGIFSPASFAPRDMSGTDFARYGYGPAKSFFENVPRNVEEYKAALAANSAPRPAPTGTGQPGLTISSTGQPTPGVANPQFAGATTVSAAIRRLAPDSTDEQIDAYLSGPEGAQFLQIMNESGITQRRARGGMMAAKGGASRGRDAYAVRGPGTGRSDEIPALLSDGEYVIDAETVAMLGDGSGEAGAKRLDELRVKIRKHKGRNLAKGQFSANAKRPDKYLSGGRV